MVIFDKMFRKLGVGHFMGDKLTAYSLPVNGCEAGFNK